MRHRALFLGVTGLQEREWAKGGTQGRNGGKGAGGGVLGTISLSPVPSKVQACGKVGQFLL